MADDAAALRREARRRKILDNSHNRLNLISGSFNNSSPTKSVTVANSSTSCTSSLYDNGPLRTENESIEFVSPSFQYQHDHNDHELTSSENEDTKTSNLWKNLITYKYDVIILSIIIQVLYSISTVTLSDTYIFLPVVIYVVVKLQLVQNQRQSSLGNILMLLNGASPIYVQRILNVSKILLTIIEDISLFLFSTICFQAIVITIRNVLAT